MRGNVVKDAAAFNTGPMRARLAVSAFPPHDERVSFTERI
jgi:hypothetical protein